MHSTAYIVGRRPAGHCAGKEVIPVHDKSVSPMHAELCPNGDRVVIKDLGSLTGTWRIEAHGNRRIGVATLDFDATVAFGQVRFRLGDLLPDHEPEPAPAPAHM